MVIAVASGKGGTGKTTVSLALAMSYDYPVTLIDSDVEEPNVSLFLPFTDNTISQDVSVIIPQINNNCIGCGKCSEVCNYNAIANLRDKAMVFDELCHSCMGCFLACRNNAIEDKNVIIGSIKKCQINDIELAEGKINIGHIMTPTVIRQLKKLIGKERLTIIDCPPGTSCPMVTATNNSDYVILVTEPTPFGLNDLDIAVNTVKLMNIPMGIIINRDEEDNLIIDDYARDKEVDIIGRIPYDLEIAKSYSIGMPLIQAKPELKDNFNNIIDSIKRKVG